MTYQRAIRSFLLAICASLSLTAVLAAPVMADVNSDIAVEITDPRLGAHSNVRVISNFTYPLEGLTPEEQAAQADALWNEALKNVVVETPPGLIGNPNSIQFADRCDPVVFETTVCPNSAQVGTITGRLESLGTLQDYLDYGYMPGAAMVPISGKLMLLRSSPEVPATIGMYVTPSLSGFSPERQKLTIEPDTASDLRLRTVTSHPVINEQPLPSDPDVMNKMRLGRMVLTLWGTLPNGNDFMTNPTECAPWTTTQWVQAWNENSNADSDPLGAGVNEFVAATPSTVMPDCSNQASLPFPAKGGVSISSSKRDYSPDFDFTIENPGVQANGQVSTSPKKVVARVPAAINVDVQQLSRTCIEADFVADQCAASTRVGNVRIETPLISAGLTGDVYLVRKPEAGLPDLGLRVRGAISFTQRGKTRYVGTKGNEIETTFDNIPQVGFSKITFHIDGGANGLLRTLACPVSNKQPTPGKFTYEFTAWTGATASSVTELNAADCFGIQKLRSFRCVYRVLRFQPTYTSRARVKKSVLYIDGKRVMTRKKVPFGFKLPVKRFKKGLHKIEVRATYDDGAVSKKRSKFRRC